MTVNDNVALMNNYQAYYQEPKKTVTGRAITTALGTLGTTAGVGVLTMSPNSPFHLGEITKEANRILSESFKGDISDLATFAKEFKSSTVKKLQIQQYGLLAAAALGTILLCFGIGSAIDNSNYDRRVKKAQKRAVELQKQSLEQIA